MISLVTSPTSPYYSPNTRVILITPPPVNRAQRPEDTTRDNVNSRAYARQVVRVGEEVDVPVVDAWTLFWDWAEEKEEALAPLLADGLHLSPQGYKVRYYQMRGEFLHPNAGSQSTP